MVGSTHTLFSVLQNVSNFYCNSFFDKFFSIKLNFLQNLFLSNKYNSLIVVPWRLDILLKYSRGKPAVIAEWVREWVSNSRIHSLEFWPTLDKFDYTFLILGNSRTFQTSYFRSTLTRSRKNIKIQLDCSGSLLFTVFVEFWTISGKLGIDFWWKVRLVWFDRKQ